MRGALISTRWEAQSSGTRFFWNSLVQKMLKPCRKPWSLKQRPNGLKAEAKSAGGVLLPDSAKQEINQAIGFSRWWNDRFGESRAILSDRKCLLCCSKKRSKWHVENSQKSSRGNTSLGGVFFFTLFPGKWANLTSILSFKWVETTKNRWFRIQGNSSQRRPCFNIEFGGNTMMYPVEFRKKCVIYWNRKVGKWSLEKNTICKKWSVEVLSSQTYFLVAFKIWIEDMTGKTR